MVSTTADAVKGLCAPRVRCDRAGTRPCRPLGDTPSASSKPKTEPPPPATQPYTATGERNLDPDRSDGLVGFGGGRPSWAARGGQTKKISTPRGAVGSDLHKIQSCGCLRA